MKTKSLILTALLTVAGTAGLMAQSSNVYSQNIVGYTTQVYNQGFTLIANQLNNGSGASVDNKLTTLLPVVPNNSFVYKWNGSGYVINDYLGGWEGDDLNMTLNPGEGLWLYTPQKFTNTYVGEVQLAGTNGLPQGFTIVSSTTPQATDLDALHFPHVNGLFTYQWDGVGYVVNDYLGGWEGDSGGNAPSLKVGESLWVFVPNGKGTNWTNSITVSGN